MYSCHGEICSNNGNTGFETVQVIRETYIRNSLGSEYRKNEIIDPETDTPKLFNEMITVAESDIEFFISHIDKTILVKNRMKVRSGLSQIKPYNNQENSELILERKCSVAPVTGALSGQMCFDQETDIPLSARLEEVSDQGKIRKTLRTIQFITGIEADPSLFVVPLRHTDFRLVDLRN